MGRKQIAAIQQQTDRMLRLCNDLLDVANLKAGRFTVDKLPAPVRALAERALGDFQPAAEEKSLRLVKHFPESDFAVACDRDQILRVLSNLIGNAIKFTRRGGIVSLRVERIGSNAQFTVEDSGSGIPEDQLRHVFDRYWQAKETARLGSGLGLSIAKGIVEAHGGRIWAESQVGVGSSFRFTLPIVDPAPGPLPPRAR